MARRPPQRPVSRQTADTPFAIPVDAGPAAAAPDPDTVSGAQAVGEARPVANREQLSSLLRELLEQGRLSAADEAAILREYDVLLAQLRTEKQRLEAEYRERAVRDGQEATDAWLADAAARLGRQQGEQMRRLLATIPALADEATTD